MANNIQNKLKAIGSDREINDLFDSIKSLGETVNDARTIDFSKIVPPPYLVNNERQIRWNYENWGTKWNSYDNYDKRDTYDTIFFKTAWSNVLNLIKILSLNFPKMAFEYSFFDEDFGANVGFYKIKNGEVLEVNTPEHFSKEAYDMALNIAEAKPEDFGLIYDENQNNYTYYDECI